MKNLFCILAALMGAIAAGRAQDAFEQGRYTENSGLQHEGLIKNLRWYKSPTSFTFKTDDTAAPVEKTIDQVADFSVGGITYERYEVDIDQSGVRMIDYSLKRDPEWLKRTVFLKKDVEGFATLYDYDNGSNLLFFYKTGGKPVQLVFKRYYADNTQSDVRKNETFKQQLWNDVKCDNATIAEINGLDYSSKSLSKYFNKVNACKGNAPAAQVSEAGKKQTWNVKVGVINGIQAFSYHVGNQNFSFSEKAYVSPEIEGEYFLPFRNNKFSALLDAAYFQFHDSGTRVENNFPASPLTLKYAAKIRMMLLSVGARYHFYLGGKSKFWLDGGLNENYSFDSSLATEQRSNTLTQDSFRKTSLSLFFGFGYSYSRLSVEARLNTTADASPYTGGGYHYENYGLALLYEILGKKPKRISSAHNTAAPR